MASHERREPTTSQSIYIAGQELIAAFRALVQSITSAGIYRNAAWPWRRTFAVNFLRATHNLSSIDAHRDSKPTTGEAVRSVCDKRGLGLHSHVVICENGPSAMLHEIPSAAHPRESVFLYFHGGGYRKPLTGPAHMPVILECSEALGVGRTFVLEYGLTPDLQYPGQLYQAACALNLLLSKLDCQLKNIVIAGDSAGGNLVLALIAHMKQPHPLVPAVDSLAGHSKLRGAVLISPWISQTYTATSYAKNAAKDYLGSASITAFTKQWAPEDELWADFLKAPADFWKDIPVRKTLLTVGGFEVFRDDVLEMAKVMGAMAGKDTAVSFVEAPAEVHVQSAVDSALGLPFCNSFLEILLWCRDLP